MGRLFKSFWTTAVLKPLDEPLEEGTVTGIDWFFLFPSRFPSIIYSYCMTCVANVTVICWKTGQKNWGSDLGLSPGPFALSALWPSLSFSFLVCDLRLKTPSLLLSQGCWVHKNKATKIVTNHCPLAFFLHSPSPAPLSFFKNSSEFPPGARGPHVFLSLLGPS